MEKNEFHSVLAEIWAMFNAVHKDGSDDGWAACVQEAERIRREHPEEAVKKIILAAVDEAELEGKAQDPKERHARYVQAAKAFNDAWKLYEGLRGCLDINAVAAYQGCHGGKFAEKLGMAAYGAACEHENAKGGFMAEAAAFFSKYRGGLGAEAYAEAERIVNRYPGHALQMAELLDGLDKRAAAKAAAA